MIRKISVACALVVAASTTWAADYQFSYRLMGDSSIKPLQVFDDGSRTFFQFPSRITEIPAIFAVVGGESKMYVPVHHGPYWVIDVVADQIDLRIKNIKAEVRTTVRPTAGAAVAPERIVPAYGVIDPLLGGGPVYSQVSTGGRAQSTEVTSSIPFAMDKAILSKDAHAVIAQALQDAGGEILFVRIVGRDDENYAEGVAINRAKAIRDAVVRYRVPAEKVYISEGIPRQGAKGKLPVSDLVIVRGQPAPVAVAAPADRQTSASSSIVLRQSMAAIQGALKALVAAGLLDSGRSETIISLIRKSVVTEEAAEPAREAVPGKLIKAWVIQPGQASLREGIAAWAKEAGYELNWAATVDYPVKDRITSFGNFQSAVNQTIALTRGAPMPLSVYFQGNTILVKGTP